MDFIKQLKEKQFLQLDEESVREIIQEEMAKFFSTKPPEIEKPNTTLFTRREAANYLGLKENTLAVWATKGTGPVLVKIGSSVRYRRSDLEQYIHKNTMPR